MLNKLCAGVGRGPTEAQGHREGYHLCGPWQDDPGGVPQAGQTELFSSTAWIWILEKRKLFQSMLR